jgi:dTDP-D-glucose 4,6-dehydratase
MKRILITGGAGFAGHRVVEHVLKNTDWEVVVLDRLNYAANGFDRLRDIEAFDDRRVTTLTADFSQPISPGIKREIGTLDFILHMGAETHVDNSILDPLPFVMSNVVGTLGILQFAREQSNLKQFIYFSTDEVFGPANEGVAYQEWDRYDSRNPYAAAKAGGEELAMAFANTYGIPVLVIIQ